MGISLLGSLQKLIYFTWRFNSSFLNMLGLVSLAGVNLQLMLLPIWLAFLLSIVVLTTILSWLLCSCQLPLGLFIFLSLTVCLFIFYCAHNPCGPFLRLLGCFVFSLIWVISLSYIPKECQSVVSVASKVI